MRNKMVQIRSLITVGTLLGALLSLSACLQQSGREGTPKQEEAEQQEKIRESELRAYCPQVSLPDQAAFYTVYERGGEGDATRILYQVAIDHVTRACRYGEGQITMEIAAAGRVVPGSKLTQSTLTMPLYVEVRRHDDVLYNKKHDHPLTLDAQSGAATQFIFKDAAVTFPQPTARNIRVSVGFNTAKKR